MARQFAAKGIAFLFVYTREAHPGEHFPAHRSYAQKLAHAGAQISALQAPEQVHGAGGFGNTTCGLQRDRELVERFCFG